MSAALGPREDPGKRASAALALAVHAALLGLLVYGVSWQTRAPQAVEVELVHAPPAPAAPVAAPPPAELRPAEPKPPRVEAKPPPKPEIALKEKEKPKPPPKAEPKIEPKPEPDKASRQLMAETMKREQQQLDQRKAEQEMANIKSAQAAAARNRAMADYTGRIRGKIRGNIVLPPDIKGNPEAVFDVVQLPSGEILSVKLKKPSGHAAYDAAVERAILKSSPLPKPEQGEVARNLELRFRPLDE